MSMFQLKANPNLEFHELHIHLFLTKALNNYLLNESVFDINNSELKALFFIKNIHDVFLTF